MTLVKHELRQGSLSFLIWTASIGLLMAICIFLFVKLISKLQKKKEAAPAPATRLCPYCRQEVAKDATRCPHCTSELPEEKK